MRGYSVALIVAAVASVSCSPRFVPSQSGGDSGPRRDGGKVDRLRPADRPWVRPDGRLPDRPWVKPDGKGCPPGYYCGDKGPPDAKPPPGCKTDADCAPYLKLCNTFTGSCVACKADTDCLVSAMGKYCNTFTGSCIACKADADCIPYVTGKFCNTTTGLCIACKVDADCFGPTAKYCNPAVGQCVACKTNTDCAAHPTAKLCDTATGSCVACMADADCAAVSGKPSCDTTSGTCVACLAWRQTGGCSANGPREPYNDKNCAAVIDPGWSGYCECPFQSIGADCGHPVGTCAAVCARGSWWLTKPDGGKWDK
jgi:hypothetical protein